MLNLDKTFCMQQHQIDLCKQCDRNFRLLSGSILDIPVSMTTFTPTLTPKQNCEGYIKDKEMQR